ncbi:phosphopantothenoylcysteine decarboxylase domain-containing protein [Breznakiellaceae bacterium SP9]
MNILITAGATLERIDGVRSISNSATGRLGSLTADSFARAIETEIAGSQIFYICGSLTLLPQAANVTLRRIEGVEDLEAAVRSLLSKERIDVIVHSMAVSDYQVQAVSTVERIADSLIGQETQSRAAIAAAIKAAPALDRSSKINSHEEHLVLLLKPAPKIIALFRELVPHAVLVGFKLLNDVEHGTLIDTAWELLEKNRCDFVLANDLRDISGDTHTGYLIDRRRTITQYSTKQEIAAGITRQVLDTIKERKQ